MVEKFKALGWSALYTSIYISTSIWFGLLLTFAITVIVFIFMKNGVSPERIPEVSSMIEEKIVHWAENGDGLMMISCLTDIVGIACFAPWYYFREKKQNFKPNYKHSLGAISIVKYIVIAYVAQFATNIVVIPFSIVDNPIWRDYEELIKSFSIDDGSTILVILSVCVIGPIFEDLLFRGMIYARLRRAYSFRVAAVISGVIFGVIHLNIIQGVYATVFGIVLAYIFEKTETVWAPIIVHMCYNSASYLLEIFGKWLETKGIEIPAYVEIIIAVIAWAVIILLLRSLRQKKETMTDEKLCEIG